MESSTSSLREQGVQALQGGQIDAAIDLLSRAVSADGHDARAQAFLGLACSQKGLHTQARQALETAVELEPQNAQYRYHLGAALEQAGELSRALQAYRETLEVDRSHSEAQTRAAALEALMAFLPAAAAEIALPPPSAARAEAPWLVGPYAAAAEADRFKPAQSAMERTEGLASPGRWLADPAGQRGNRRVLGFIAVSGVAAVCLIGWLLARWLPGVLREAARPRPSPAVQSLLIRAWKAEKSAHSDEAERLFRQALEEARVLGDQPGEAISLSGLGYLWYEHKQSRRALAYLQPALVLFRQLGDKWNEANTLNNIGLAYSDLRQPPRALEYLRQALASCRETGEKKLEAEIIDSFGMVYEAAGQTERALPYYQETLARARQIEDKEIEALEIKNIARLQRHLPGHRRPVASAGTAPARAAPLPGGGDK